MMKRMADYGGITDAAHQSWLRAQSVSAADRSVYESEALHAILGALTMIDQVNLPNLVGGELLVRRIALIREAHRISPGAPDYSASDHFMGWGRRREGGGIAPALSRHVATELQSEAAVAKEARKAREEQQLRRPVPQG